MKKVDKETARDVKKGVRLNIRKAPKTEVPKTVYTRKKKHKKTESGS
jgi:hypothetical protein